MELQKRNEKLREASGEVAFSDPLTTFLYLLMRNELAAGKVEDLVREAVDSSEECLFTNGWLAHYANNLAETIKDVKANHLKIALEKVFVEHKKEKVEKAAEEVVEKAKDVKDSADENFGDKALSELEQKLIQISGESKVTDTGEEKPKTSGEIAIGAKEAVQQLVASGFMSQDDADNLKSDISDVVTEAEKPVGDAEEIVKEHTEEEKWTSEKAGHVVKKAFRAFERAAKPDVTLTDPIEVQKEALAEDDKKYAEQDRKAEIEHNQFLLDNLDMVKKQNPNMSEEELGMFTKALKDDVESTTTVDVTGVTEEDISKWKKTNEELQKIEEEKSMPETLVGIVKDAKPGEISEAVKNQMEEWTKEAGSKEKVLDELNKQLDEELDEEKTEED